MRACLGIDTSNYTTSAAVYREDGTGKNAGKLLTVPEGAIGLRQSDALFQHVKRLPDRFRELSEEGWLTGEFAAVGASTRPREAEGSYMPCFLAGASQAQVLAEALRIPFFAFSHQQGHLAAACWSAGRQELLDRPFLAWHLSGGTTELLLAVPEGRSVHADCIGGAADLSAGQLIDRTGRLLGLPFPAGKALDALSRESGREAFFPVRIGADLRFSLSGMENQVGKLAAQGAAKEDIARFALETIAQAVRRATEQAQRRYPGLPVVFSGGVASNTLLRGVMGGGVFAQPQYAADNAMGIAILASRRLKEG